MTKCQTNLVRKKFFHPFFGLFSTQNHSNRKKKIFENFSFFWKFWPKMTLFGPNFDPKSQIWPKIFFSWSWSPTISNEGSHAYVWKSSIFRSVLGPLGPNPGKPDFSGKIRLGQISSNIVPQLQAKNQENRWSRFPEIFYLPSFLGHFGSFWAILGPFGPKSGKPDFSGEIRLCQFSSFMVPKLHAKNQKNPWSRFPGKVRLPNQLTIPAWAHL